MDFGAGTNLPILDDVSSSTVRWDSTLSFAWANPLLGIRSQTYGSRQSAAFISLTFGTSIYIYDSQGY